MNNLSNSSQAELVQYLHAFSRKIIYFHLCVYAQGIVGGVCGFLFLIRLGKPFARYNYPPSVRIWFLCLSFTDVLSLFGYSYLSFYNQRTNPGDYFTMIIDLINSISDIFNVCMQIGVSIERVIVLNWELKSRHWVTPSCVKWWLVVCAIFSVFNGTAAVITRWYTKGASQVAWVISNLFLLVVFVCLMVASSIWILLLMRQKSQERMSLLSESFKVSQVRKDSCNETSDKQKRALEINREINIAVRLLGANLLFILCYIPMFVLATARGVLALRRSPAFPLISIIQHLFTPILRYNNALNWIPIYLCNKKFRKHFTPFKPWRKREL